MSFEQKYLKYKLKYLELSRIINKTIINNTGGAAAAKPTCLVKNCHHNTSHQTEGHQCGICNYFGHGKMECKIRKEAEAKMKKIPGKIWTLIQGPPGTGDCFYVKRDDIDKWVTAFYFPGSLPYQPPATISSVTKDRDAFIKGYREI